MECQTLFSGEINKTSNNVFRENRWPPLRFFSFSTAETLKIRSRSPKSYQFFIMPQLCNHENLVISNHWFIKYCADKKVLRQHWWDLHQNQYVRHNNHQFVNCWIGSECFEFQYRLNGPIDNTSDMSSHIPEGERNIEWDTREKLFNDWTVSTEVRNMLPKANYGKANLLNVLTKCTPPYHPGQRVLKVNIISEVWDEKFV